MASIALGIKMEIFNTACNTIMVWPLCSLVASSQTSHPVFCFNHPDLLAAPPLCHASSDHIAWKHLLLFTHMLSSAWHIPVS